MIQASSEHFARSVACYLYPELRQRLESEVGAQLHFVTFFISHDVDAGFHVVFNNVLMVLGVPDYLTHVCFLPTVIFPISYLAGTY